MFITTNHTMNRIIHTQQKPYFHYTLFPIRRLIIIIAALDASLACLFSELLPLHIPQGLFLQSLFYRLSSSSRCAFPSLPFTIPLFQKLSCWKTLGQIVLRHHKVQYPASPHSLIPNLFNLHINNDMHMRRCLNRNSAM